MRTTTVNINNNNDDGISIKTNDISEIAHVN